MDLAGGLKGGGVAPDGPGAHLIGANGEEREQPQQVIREADDARQPQLLDAVFSHEHFHILRRQLGQLHLQLAL